MTWSGRIEITVIPHAMHRYPTCGDWSFDVFGVLHIRVSRMDDWRSELAVAVHEAFESLSCMAAGVTEQQVDAWDLKFEQDRDDGKHSPDDEPGSARDCPYRQQHINAEQVEKALLFHANMSWVDHVERIEALDSSPTGDAPK